MLQRLALLTATVAGGAALSVGLAEYSWSPTHWVNALEDAPPARAHHALVYDPVRKRVLLTAGSTPLEGGRRYRFFNDMWEFDGAEWKALTPSGDETSGVRLAFDTRRSRLLSFGGFVNNTSKGDLRVLDDNAWKTMGIHDSMPAAEPGFVYDATRDRFVAFGGSAGRYMTHGDTWEFDGAHWRKLAVVSPPARSGHAMVYDEERKRTLVFGGMGAGSQSAPSPALADTWEFDGKVWTQLTVSGPTSRHSAGIAYDARRKRVILFGGLDKDGFRNDTWSWNGREWRLLTDSGPEARAMGMLAYDVHRDKIVLFGGRKGFPNGDLNDTWEFDGARWKRIQ